MNKVLVHIVFPYAGPWGQDMSQAFAELADSISQEPGLHWKLWLEDAATGQSGGAYLFAHRAAADHYLSKHLARLTQWGITDCRVTITEVNAELSARSRATGSAALPTAARVD